MKGLTFYRYLFLGAGIYDCWLGLAFVFFHPGILGHFEVPPPRHPGYIQLPGLFMVAMGVADYFIFRDPIRNRDIVKVRILMKLAYSGLCFYYFAVDNLSDLFFNIAVFNFVFLIPYASFLVHARGRGGGEA
jgi:hypothetical protein